jgi:hypothetical protein
VLTGKADSVRPISFGLIYIIFRYLNTMARHFITFFIFLIAILFYYVGLNIAATGLVILGVGFEAIFWFKLFGLGKK